MTSTKWSRLAMLGVLVGVLAGLVAAGGCKGNSGGTGGGREDDDPIATDLDPNGDGVWSPDEAADSIAEAAAEACKNFEPDRDRVMARGNVIEAGVEAAVDQAMLVAPDLGVDTEWREAIDREIANGVVRSEAGAVGKPDVLVLEEFIKSRVRAKTLEWFRSPR